MCSVYRGQAFQAYYFGDGEVGHQPGGSQSKMKKKTIQQLLVLALLLFGVAEAKAASPIGNRVEDFTLKSHRGREYSLSDFANKKILVIAFLGTECPLVKLYGPRLAEMQNRFAKEGVEFIGINSNTQDSVTEMTAFAERNGISFPLLKDLGNRVADAMGAERTPEVFILDADRKVRYHGRIDDQYGVGYLRDRAERQDVALAVEELLAGKDVTVPQTKVVGCHIGRVSQVEPTGDITYSNQISRIFNRRCVECHRDGEIAPFTLTSYEDVIGWEDTILEVIEEKRMPPWFANPKHGSFKNDARLSDEERQLISNWVANGMPEGDPVDLPEPTRFVKGWRIPEPDQIFYMRKTPFEVPSQGTVDYQQFIVDPGWEEDKYISAAEARPDNTSVVHHILIFILPAQNRRRADLRSVLVGYAPGSLPILLEPGTAIHVPAGSRLLFQMHYTPNGHREFDRSYAGVCFVDKETVEKTLNGRLAIKTDFKIKPHDPNVVVKAKTRLRRDEILLSMTPHLHLRGKSFRYEATYPNGEQEVLLDVPNYDFNWQLKYLLAEPKLLPRGTTILCTATYDNSEDNLVNPDPTKTVRWGDQSWEEMMIGFFDTVPVGTVARNELLKSKNVKVDPSGNWEWVRSMGRRKSKESLTLKMNDDVLSGVLESRQQKMEIESAVVDGDQISFQVGVNQFGGILLEFQGRVNENKIEGDITYTIEAIGREGKIPWKATRVP